MTLKKKQKIIIPVIVIAIAGIIIYSCSYNKIDTQPSCSIPATVSFHKNILPIFNNYCNQGGCHSGGSPAGHLDLTDSLAYKQLMVRGTGYIDTITPTNSILYIQLYSSFDLMPPAGELDSCTQQLILVWIKQGAKNN